jgi:hypothetical protein
LRPRPARALLSKKGFPRVQVPRPPRTIGSDYSSCSPKSQNPAGAHADRLTCGRVYPLRPWPRDMPIVQGRAPQFANAGQRAKRKRPARTCGRGLSLLGMLRVPDRRSSKGIHPARGERIS